jgi:hypothetical protein
MRIMTASMGLQRPRETIPRDKTIDRNGAKPFWSEPAKSPPDQRTDAPHNAADFRLPAGMSER